MCECVSFNRFDFEFFSSRFTERRWLNKYPIPALTVARLGHGSGGLHGFFHKNTIFTIHTIVASKYGAAK